MENISQMSLLEVAILLMEQKKNKQPIKTLIKEVLEMKGLDDLDHTLATQLYIDITTSSKFVYMGDGEWDLKIRQSLDEYDKDGSAFNSKDAFVEDEEDIKDIEIDEEEEFDDEDDEYDYEDDEEYDDDEYDDEEDEDDDYEYDDEDDYISDEILADAEVYSEDDFNEDKYNDLMDDYEDMYEE
jgi:DNA-directed RNA polymerase subunit delta